MALTRWNKTATPVPGTTTVGISQTTVYGYSYTFPTFGQGSVALVSVSVPNSPPGTQWLVSIGGQEINGIYGAAAAGPYWCQGGDVITVQSTPGTIFTAPPGNAVAIGVVGNEGELSPSGVQSGGGIPIGNNLIADLQAFPLSPFGAGTVTPSINFSLNARGLIVSANSPPISPPGSASQYFPIDQAAFLGSAGGNAFEGTWWIATPGLESIQIAFAGTPTYYLVAEIDYDFDFPNLFQVMAEIGVTLPLSAASGGFLSDSSGNGSTLTQTGTVTFPSSPAGAAFNQAADFSAGALGNFLRGPTGTGLAAGAAAGSAFTAEFFYTPSSADLATNAYPLTRAGGAEWLFVYAPGDGGMVAEIDGIVVGNGTTMTAGVTYHVALTWTGTVWHFWINGVDQGTPYTHGAPAIGSVAMQISGYSTTAGGITGYVDEVRISNIARYTTTFIPPTGPFTTDANTEMLYHFDAPSAATSIILNGWETVCIIEAAGSSTPVVTDAKGIAYPIVTVAAAGLWYATIPSAVGSPIEVSTSASGTAVLRSVNPYLG